MAQIAVMCYSATGNVHRLALAVADGAAEECADTRIRYVAESGPELAISFKQQWRRYRSEFEEQPQASPYTTDHRVGPPDEKTPMAARAWEAGFLSAGPANRTT